MSDQLAKTVRNQFARQFAYYIPGWHVTTYPDGTYSIQFARIHSDKKCKNVGTLVLK